MFKNQSKSIILNSSEITLYTSQTLAGMRTPDDIIRMALPTTLKDKRLVLDLSQLIHNHPEFFPDLTELLRSQLGGGNRAASVRRHFEDLRWERHWSMRNALVPLIGRTLLYVNCDMNGMVQLNPVPLDAHWECESLTGNCPAIMRGGWSGATDGHSQKRPHQH